MLTKMSEQPYLHLASKVIVFVQSSHEILFFDRETPHLSVCSVDEAVPFGVAYLEASNVGAHSKLDFVELTVVNFKTNIIIALFYK